MVYVFSIWCAIIHLLRKMSYSFKFRKSVGRICQVFGNRISKLKRLKGHLDVEKDDEVIRCQKMDVVIELNDVL